MMKRSILIVYEDSHEELAHAAHALKTAFEAASRKVKVLEASETNIPNMLAASAYVFGTATNGHPSYAEIGRFLKGVNLAGRYAGFFSRGGGKAAACLKAMMKDAELSLHGELLTSFDPESIRAWVAAFDLGD